MSQSLRGSRLSLVVLLVVVTGCHGAASNRGATTGAGTDEAAVRAQADAWSRAIVEKNLEKTLEFYAPDAHYLSAGRPIADTPTAIRQLWVEDFAIPGFASDEVTTRIEVSSAGDLAYQLGKYTLTQTGQDGAPTQSVGKFAVIWKKQPNGNWKAIVDADNADQ